jgi:two-component system, LuxR family, sensor kinase FixL
VAIASNAQAVRRLLRSETLDRDGIADAVQDIVGDAWRASEIIRRLHVLFRKEPAGHSPVAINDVIREVTGLLTKDLERRGVSLKLLLTPGLPPVSGDVVQLQQVVLNVLINACEAMATTEPGGREVSIESSYQASGILEVTVRDSGVGVEDAEVDRIFEGFVTNKPTGLGMGLSISRLIIHAHGGRIWATRNEDRGLTMHIELPCLPA